MKKTIVTKVALFACVAWVASADPVTLDLLPGTGTLSGDPGSVVGWGFTLTNATRDFLVVANSSFCEGGQTSTSGTCSPRLGVYSDIAAGNAIVVDPGSTITQAFSVDGSSGLGSFSIWSSAKPGQNDTGSISLVYDLFDTNPFSTPANQVGGDHFVSTPAEVNVRVAGTDTPEPALPLLSGIIGLGVVALTRRLSSRLRGNA